MARGMLNGPSESELLLITVILGLSAALTYGVADFLGGLASRRARPLVVTTGAAVVGIAPLLVAVPILGATFTPGALVWGAVAGCSGAVGVLLLYTALAIGPMSILSPITSVFTALLPVIVALASGTRLPVIAVVAIGAAFVAIVLVASVRDTSGARVTVRGLVSAAIAGCGFGGIVLAYQGAGAHMGTAPLIVARVVQALVMGAGLVIVGRRTSGSAWRPSLIRDLRPLRRAWIIVVVCGVFDASANVFIQLALHVDATATSLPTVSVLNALYPIGTVALAAIVLRERLTPLQVGGLVLAFVSSAVLALA
jgi:drug/metabolite transporter (DMT)-like permease